MQREPDGGRKSRITDLIDETITPRPRHADTDPISVSVGTLLWLPLGGEARHAGDSTFRLMPKIAVGGVVDNVRWGLTGGVILRETSEIDDQVPGDGNAIGPEAQIGASVGYISDDHRLTVGPEAVLGLDLRENAIPDVPPELGKLTALRSLLLGRNPITALPAELGKLSKLQGLYVSDTSLSEFPFKLKQWPALRKLEVERLPLKAGELARLEQEFGKVETLYK